MNGKTVSGIMSTLLLVGMLTLAFNIEPVKTIALMDGYCWVDGDNLDVGFSKYGEMMSYDEATGVGVGLQYPGYKTVETHDQTDGTSRDPFAHEGIPVKYWLNGWLLELRYTHKPLGDRRILAAALFADMRSYGGDWIVGKKLPFPTFPYGGRKTTAYAETEAIQVLDDDPQRFIALCTTHIYDWEDSDENEIVNHPAETWPVVDVLITIIFNKEKNEVIIFKDVKLVICSAILGSCVHCQFSNRGEWDLGPDPAYESYAHFYHDSSADIAQVISEDLDYVGWAAFCPHLSDYTVDGWAKVFDPLLNVSQPDMIPAGSEPDIPFVIGEWDFILDYVDPFAAQFRGASIYGISDLIDGDDQDVGLGHENIVDSAVVIDLPPVVPTPPDLIVFDPEIDGLHVWINGVVLPGTEGASITRIHWDWGDGWEEDHWFPASHTYSSGGNYTITVTAYQSDGLTSTMYVCISRHTRIRIRTDGSVKPDSAPISSVDNVTYTFTDNIYGEILVERDNIVIDGAGYTLHGTGSGIGVNMAWRSNLTIKRMEIKTFEFGIWLDWASNNNTVSGNNITANYAACMLYHSLGNTVSGNSIANNRLGIRLYDSSDHNTISENNITNNNYGIWLSSSSYNTISGNNFKGGGLSVYDSYQNIVEDNVVNGKPLVYLEDASDIAVESAGQVILVDCNNIRVENLDLSNTTVGVELFRTDNTRIIQNNMTNNRFGIQFYESSNNIISGNNVTNTCGDGVCLYDSSDHNTISENNITNNNYGISLRESSSNTISGNSIANNRLGIHLYVSSNNTVSENNITNNKYGIGLFRSSSNTISGNNITNNAYGVSLYESSSNSISHSNFSNNTQQVYDISWDSQSYAPSINVWDDGYPSGGNFWSDHATVDDCCGVNQDEPGSDGIVDKPYIIDNYNRDNYPLVEPWSPLPKTIDQLKTEIEKRWSEGEIDNHGIATSLLAKLNAAQKSVQSDGSTTAAKNILKAFINEVQAQSGKHITPEAADILIKSAEHILSHL